MTRIPERFPSTGAESAISITRAVTHHRLGMNLTFPGRLDAERLARAVRLSLDAEPILGCAFRTDAFRPYWQRRDDLDRTAAFDVAGPGAGPEQALAFQAEEVPDEGPQVRVLLLSGDDHDDLSIKLSHVVADGQATKQYAYLLAHLYSALGGDPDFEPEPNLERRPDGTDVWAGLTAEQRREAKKAKSWTNATWTVPFGGAGKRPAWELLAIEPALFGAIKEYGRTRRATVNDLLLAAVFRGCAKSFGTAAGVAQAFMCTADLRRYLPQANDIPICNLSISGSLEIEHVDGEPFDATLTRVHESMAAWARTCHGAAPLVASEKMAAFGYRFTRTLLGAGLKMGARSGKSYQWFTNIGIIDDSLLAFGDQTPSDAYIVGPVAPRSVVPTISTYRDRLHIALGHCASDCEPGQIATLLGDIGAELRLLAFPQMQSA